jgi:hypothetical protein
MPVLPDDIDALTGTHPALVDSVVRWRGAGGWGATASILRAIEVGALSVGMQHKSVALRLVPGVAAPRHPHLTGPFVERGHVEGLSSFDRQLLSMLFDDIADAPQTDMARVSEFRRAHPLGFWTRLRDWRESVNAEAMRLRSRGRLPVTRTLLFDARHLVVDALFDESCTDQEWSKVAAIALVAGLDDMVTRTAEIRLGHVGGESITGPAGVLWLACLRSGRRTGIRVLRHLFSPLRPSSYPPAQYVTLVLPPHRRARFIDDGSLRLGG